MNKKNIHVVTHPEGWAIKKEGNTRASEVFQTQREAENVANRIGKREHTEVLIHGQNGKIRERNSYGNDPFPPKDKK